ncbi:putative bifunctional diguanylate cyclase/phosphodiesterase [Planctomycetes bacterium K23_9]|uniref:Cyclic di-GMP phosphodiesterase Gmr n=1 Tax=Stieleria marina TaxID=1930275 RepID=A0A517P1X6_9BACT|nr:Cyclic di-GMP phosphodiesterase Gmr [Planctomycetes bacterium K23_9]
MNDWGKPTQTDEVFVESTNTGDLRAQRVWLFASVMSATWLFFAIFLWWRQFSVAAQACVGAFLTISLINFLYRNSDNFSRIMNLNLATSAVGLFCVSVSDPAMHGTMLFYPVSILVSSQLLGVRSAFVWFCINLVVMTGFFLWIDGVDVLFSTNRLDELVLLLGVAACVYFCCHQGEEYYRRRTDGLIDLSQDLQAKSETLHTLATTDALTGLVNRFQFQERLRETVQESIETSIPMALYLIDMDGFKEINDTLGHPVGDEALVSIANLLHAEFGGDAEVARLGGDEFCLIKTNVGSPDDADAIAQAVLELLTHRCVLADTSFPLSASVGYCRVPEHATTDKDVLAFADTAMFHAKEHRLGYACYEREMTEKLVEYRTVQEKLSLALERAEFFLVYQPQVCLETEVVTGVEALLRWRSDGEIVSPVRFIHLLERSREILPVSNWIIQQACCQLAQWDAEGFSISMSVNVSALQFADPDFLSTVQNAIQTYGVDPKQLDFEITEGLLIDDIEAAVEKLNQLKVLGASISIDDFGTGYSSLAYLRQLPIDRLKIDRAFIKDFPDADDGMIANSIIVLAKSLGLKVLAEGVETKQQLDFLHYQDCNEYQGYYFSRPVLPDEAVPFFTMVNESASLRSKAKSNASIDR